MIYELLLASETKRHTSAARQDEPPWCTQERKGGFPTRSAAVGQLTDLNQGGVQPGPSHALCPLPCLVECVGSGVKSEAVILAPPS